jgi:ketosteroid isomerase-like protein
LALDITTILQQIRHATFIVATGTTINGKDELKAGAQNHRVASPDRVKKLVNLFATDELACLEYTSGGTLEAQANFGDIAIKPTGKKYELQCCFVFHFRPDGKIDLVREYFDMGTVTR